MNDSEFYQGENSRRAKIKEPFWLKNAARSSYDGCSLSWLCGEQKPFAICARSFVCSGHLNQFSSPQLIVHVVFCQELQFVHGKVN